MNVDYIRYLVPAGNFLNFRLCEIQLGAQCFLGEHGLFFKVLVSSYDRCQRFSRTQGYQRYMASYLRYDFIVQIV